MITEEQYYRLCTTCDQLLNENVSVARMAIPMLHVVREHPVFLEKYEHFFSTTSEDLHKYKVANGNVSSKVSRLISYTKKLILSNNWWFYSEKSGIVKPRVFFVSHFLNEVHAGNENDFYFGSIPTDLYKNDIETLLVLINHSPIQGGDLAKSWKKAAVNRLVLSNSLGLFAELYLHVRCFFESLKLKKQAKKAGDDLLQKVAFSAAREVRSGQTLQNLRIGRQIRKLVKTHRPDMIFTTFEGHAWERVVFAEARRYVPTIRCCGYQHAAIFKLQYAIKRSLGGKYDPDCIFTAGQTGADQIAGSSYKNVNVDVLGTSKLQSYEYEQIISRQKQICLVIPEGLESECLLLFAFSIQCADVNPDITFVWRVHPIISIEYLKEKFEMFKDLPANIILSNQPLESDLRRSTWALYRGTTTVIQAVLANVYPIYYKTTGFLIDPLYMLGDESFYVTNIDEFKKLVKDKNVYEDMGKVKRVASLFFSPVNITVLNKYLV